MYIQQVILFNLNPLCSFYNSLVISNQARHTHTNGQQPLHKETPHSYNTQQMGGLQRGIYEKKEKKRKKNMPAFAHLSTQKKVTKSPTKNVSKKKR